MRAAKKRWAKVKKQAKKAIAHTRKIILDREGRGIIIRSEGTHSQLVVEDNT